MEVITWNGKRYPRFERGRMMGVTEAMERLGATKFAYGSNQIVIFMNQTDAPESILPRWMKGREFRQVVSVGGSEHDLTHYHVSVDDVEMCLKSFGFPSCRHISPELQTAMDDVKVKEARAKALRQIADAATFAIEESKGDVNCEVTNDLLTHWRDQEHDYLVALSEFEAALANLKKLS